MKVLVTGASGFIGSHLVESLVSEGNDVISFVKNGGEISNLENVITKIVYGDLRDMDSIVEAVKGVDQVYHLAAIPNLQGSMTRANYYDINVEGTRKVLDACISENVKQIIYVSSLEAVGASSDGNPVNEETKPQPNNIYGESKLEAERIAKEYRNKYKINIVIVRLPMVYGPRNYLHLRRFFKMVNSGYYPLIGNGKVLIEFCYIKNAIQGLMLAAAVGKPGHIYFISDERSYEFKEVIDIIAQQLNVKICYIRIPIFLANGVGLAIEILSKILKFYPFIFEGTGRPAFTRISVDWMTKSALFCDITKARDELGYTPACSLSDGIRENIEWYKKKGEL